ncbi:MAG TPA: acetylxylan esterase [Phycisphaerae bacterium]|nr:acetylxylan esterase [Phycisphaerae bacterium]
MAGALFSEPRQTEDQGREQLAAFAKTYQTRQEWEARAAGIREGILREIRLAPLPKKCPLNPVIRDRKEQRGYTVENVAIEALPGFYVTGNLYRPAEAKPPMAGVLCPHGHSQHGRLEPYTQTRCATLARMGAVVFAWDMCGWSESTQVKHDDPNVMTLQHYSSMRALDFLLSQEGIDPKRIACTGESGGGTQTFLLAALDDRVKVAAPVVMVSAHFFGGC